MTVKLRNGAAEALADVVIDGMTVEVAVEFVPQGTLAERLRDGGAGIPAFFTRTGFATSVADGKELRDFAGASYITEEAIVADLALVKAWRGDPAGNIAFRKTARNFNPLVAAAGRTTVAEVEELVPAGGIDPDHVHTPGIYVDRLVVGRAEKVIEQRTVRAEAA